MRSFVTFSGPLGEAPALHIALVLSVEEEVAAVRTQRDLGDPFMPSAFSAMESAGIFVSAFRTDAHVYLLVHIREREGRQR